MNTESIKFGVMFGGSIGLVLFITSMLYNYPLSLEIILGTALVSATITFCITVIGVIADFPPQPQKTSKKLVISNKGRCD